MAEEKVQEEPKSAGGAGGAETVIAEYQSAQTYRKWVLRILFFVILAIVLVGFLRFYTYGKGVYTEVLAPETQASMLADLQSDLYPRLKLHGQRLQKSLVPQLVEMAKQKAEAARPELEQAFGRERGVFEQNVKQMLREKGQTFATTIVEEHKDTLQAEFPDVSAPAKMEALINLLVEATRDVAVKVFLDKRLNPHIEVIKSMDGKIKMLPVCDPSLSDRELLGRAGEVAWDLWAIKTSKGGAEQSVTPSAAQ